MTNPVPRRAVLAGVAGLPLAALAGCTGGEPRPSAAAGGPARVRVLTGLGFQGREAYLDVATEMGWFAELGLEVEVLPGEGTEQNLTLLSAGQAEFATLDVNAALIEHSRGTFTDFRLTAVLQDLLLSCVMVLESSGIDRPRDLEGATIAYIPGGINDVVFPVFAQLAGFDAGSVELVGLPPPSFGAALAEGRVDAIMQFVVGRHTIEQAAGGQPVRVFAYADWLSELYGSGIGCPVALVDRDPGLVRRFNTAALRGLAYAVANPQEAGEVFAARHDGQDVAAAAAEVAALAGYVRPGEGFDGQELPLGEFSEVRLVQSVALLEGLGVIEAGFRFADVVGFGLVR
ncbi:MAG: thiamine biosynthesis protein [Micromonosporaceae bacterium]|nr:thiamine biosynthesis protein [Micromonosporaceae bacterium]